MPTLTFGPHQTVPVLPTEEALEGVELVDDTPSFVDKFLHLPHATPGTKIRMHDLSPMPKHTGLITHDIIKKYFDDQGLVPAGIHRTFSYLKHNPLLIVPGLIVPVIAIWDEIDRRQLRVSCDFPGCLVLEAIPIETRQSEQSWRVHDKYHFLAAVPIPA
jgi:hypothetical protein